MKLKIRPLIQTPAAPIRIWKNRIIALWGVFLVCFSSINVKASTYSVAPGDFSLSTSFVFENDDLVAGTVIPFDLSRNLSVGYTLQPSHSYLYYSELTCNSVLNHTGSTSAGFTMRYNFYLKVGGQKYYFADGRHTYMFLVDTFTDNFAFGIEGYIYVSDSCSGYSGTLSLNFPITDYSYQFVDNGVSGLSDISGLLSDSNAMQQGVINDASSAFQDTESEVSTSVSDYETAESALVSDSIGRLETFDFTTGSLDNMNAGVLGAFWWVGLKLEQLFILTDFSATFHVIAIISLVGILLGARRLWRD